VSAPARLGKYAIVEVLGSGAMGVVYKGFDPGIHRTVAIKTIRRELIAGDRPAAAMLARFRNEARAAGRLAHPGRGETRGRGKGEGRGRSATGCGVKGESRRRGETSGRGEG
jgi:serine/threonine protein kinase